MKETKHLNRKPWNQTGAFGALFSFMCVYSVTREPLFIGGPGILNHPNYTFSIPDKRLYTFFKGITVTPCFVRATSVSSHGGASFTRDTFCLSFVQRPLHVRRAYMWRAPLMRPGPPHVPYLRRRSDPRRNCSHGRSPGPPI
jgi:hypothetical protein